MGLLKLSKNGLYYTENFELIWISLWANDKIIRIDTVQQIDTARRSRPHISSILIQIEQN